MKSRIYLCAALILSIILAAAARAEQKSPPFNRAHLQTLFYRCAHTRGHRWEQRVCEREFYNYLAIMPKGKK